MSDQSATFATRAQAKEWARKKESELRESRYFPREEGRHQTFGAFVDHYIEKIIIKNPQSFAKQRQLMLWWKEHLGKYFLIHITPPMIAQLRDQLLEEVTCRGKKRSTSIAVHLNL